VALGKLSNRSIAGKVTPRVKIVNKKQNKQGLLKAEEGVI
jgi:hypothetical protein